MGKGYNVAIVGATGAVGREMVEVLAERRFPVDSLRLLASTRSAGEEMDFGSHALSVRELEYDSFQGINLALFSAGAAVSKQFAPLAVKAGTVVVDNSSAFRMEPDVPLVVPEVNPQAVREHQGIIANPNCSTIQMVVALKPLHDQARIKRIVVSTYQSVSGTGKLAMDELFKQSQLMLSFQKDKIKPKVYPRQIAFNCLPHIDEFLENGYTKEEMKMVNETRKIMGEDSLPITATTVRVPVFISHAESVNIETEIKLSAEQARQILAKAPGVKVVDAPKTCQYPLALEASGTDEVFVGRIREDESVACGLNLWIVADNLRKGAALNAVQIAELLVKQGLL